jgi:hypothetical protein
MNASSNPPAAAELHTILALVAGSTILPSGLTRPAALFSDWEKERKSANVDALILAWIASHVPGSTHRGRLH